MQPKKLENIYREISKLNNNEKKIILSKLVTEINLTSSNDVKYTITGIRGIGKEIWREVDAQNYVNNERAAWD